MQRKDGLHPADEQTRERRLFMRAFLSMQGRYNRARYFWSLLCIYVLVLVVALFVQLVMSLSGAGAADAEAVVGLVGLADQC